VKKHFYLIAAGVTLSLIVTAESARGSIQVTGTGTKWESTSSVTISWQVSEKGDNTGWTYQYCWDFPDERTNISHLIIEVTPDARSTDFSNFFTSLDSGVTWVAAQEGSVSVQEFTSGNGSNPGMPDDMWGIKFDGDAAFGGQSAVCIKFDSIRAPVWGDFYAKGGNDGGAWNDGFTTDDSDPMTAVVLTGTLPDSSQDPQHIVRPNGAIPEPASFVVWFLMGLTWAGSAWTYRYRHRWQKWQREEEEAAAAAGIRAHNQADRFAGRADEVEEHVGVKPVEREPGR
jgi:hypothetical protein